MKRLHRLCKDPSKRSEGTVAKLVEVTCALCHFFRTMPTQLQFEVRQNCPTRARALERERDSTS